MHPFARVQPRRWTARLTAVALLAGIALGGGTAHAADEPHTLNVGFTYLPNIQAAPFYVAEELGFYKQAGLKVNFTYHKTTEPEFGALTAGREDVVAYAGGDEILQARSASVPVVDIGTLFNKYPVAVMVRAESPIHTAADLKGHSIGTPGPYGANDYLLRAVLRSAGLSTSDVRVDDIGFTQQEALAHNKVDAITGYVNNDAVALERAGVPVRQIPIAGETSEPPLVSVGLGTSQKLLTSRRADLQKFIAATLEGVQYTLDHLESAVDLSRKFIPGSECPEKRAEEVSVLRATLPFLQWSGSRPGHNDLAAWQRMTKFMSSEGLLDGPVNPEDAFDNSLLPRST